jgi:hypothetical protein
MRCRRLADARAAASVAIDAENLADILDHCW